MTVKRILTAALILLSSFILIAETASARDWDDLHEEDEKVFGSEKEMKYNPDMFFLQRESWDNHYSLMIFWLYKYTDYPNYSSLRLFPLYYGLESKIDNRKQSFIPILLTYWETDFDEKFRINPLFVSGSSKSGNSEEHYSYSWIHGYSWYNNSKMQVPEKSWWFPIIPLVYRSTDSYGGHMNIGWLLDYSWSRDKEGEESLKRFWFIPLLFHEPGNNGYTHALPPLFLYNRHINGEYWISLFPLFKRSKDKNYVYGAKGKSSYEYEDSFKSLLFCYNSVYTDEWKGEKKISEFWFPVIPLVYSYDEPGVESHRNIFWLIDWHNDAEGNTDRFWFAPFYFRGDSYRHILPPVYMNFHYSDNDNYSHLLPFYLSSRSESTAWDPDKKGNIKTKERLLLTLFSGYSSEKAAEGESSIDSVSYWAPIIPLYYHSEWSEGSHTNILWAFDWGRDREGKMERFWFIPFVFHETGEGGYRFYIPFFFRPSGWSEESGVTYSPVYYHRWSPEEDTKWSWLIHYKRSNSKTGEHLNTWVPFYYNHTVPMKSETTWITPLYYHHDSLEHGGYFARMAFPLYWNFETDKRDTTLFLPLYFDTKDKNGKNSFYVNILGLSRSVTSGVNPVIDADLGFNEKGLYLDTDTSWLIDVVSLSTRITLPLKKGENEEIAEDTDSTDEGEVILSKKREMNRENSINFWGLHLLFGLVAAERADTKRHFRLLPLSWITWDERSENRMKWIVNYLSYKEEETEYLVVFPFYGYQREGESYSKGYLLNAYWHEYDHEKEMHEYTVLWPFINWYNSNEKNGWRVAPFVWHKNITEDGILHSSTYTPLYMNRSRKKIEDDSTEYRLNLSLFHFYRYSEDKEGTSKLWFSSIPVVFHKENETIVKETGTIPAESGKSDTESISETKPLSDYKTTDTLKWVFPIYLVSESETGDKTNNITTSEYTLYGLPLLYYHSLTEKGSDPAEPEKKHGIFFLLGYYKEFSSDSNSSSILFGLYETEKYPATGGYSYSALYGLFNLSDNEGNYENYFRPFYYYGNDNGKKEHSALMGIYRKKDDPKNGDSGFSLLYGLYSSSIDNINSYDGSEEVSALERKRWLIPVFYNRERTYTVQEKEYSDNVSFSLLHYRHRTNERFDNSYTFWAPILPLYYYSEDEERSHTNILWLVDYEKGKTDDYSRFWFMPFYFSKPGDEGYFHIAPLYFSSWDRKENDNMYIICGLYLHNMPGYSRQNFLYLYDHISYDSGNYNEYSMLFTTIEFEIDPEVKRMQALWGLLLDAEWGKSGYDIEGLLWLAAVERDGGYFHTRALPLWYYESTETTHTLVIPPALTWDSRDSDNSRFQLWALGALWYRDYEPAESSDLQAALLGIPYYKIQRAERGYESRGSLWGLLWEYETESETGFSKFSLMKFIYKRVEMDGEVQHRVLGITF